MVTFCLISKGLHPPKQIPVMTLSIVPVDQAGIDDIAVGLSGFSHDSAGLRHSMMTLLFIACASQASKEAVPSRS